MSKRLQPSLLDRLTDDQPDTQVEAVAQREFSTQELRRRVRRDLAWLLNTANLGTADDLTGYPHAAASVVNFGLSDLTGRTATSVCRNTAATELMLQEAIWRFEPRLIKKSVRVEILSNETSVRYNQLAFIIHAQLWAEPVPLRLTLRTDLNLETGDASVVEATETEVA